MGDTIRQKKVARLVQQELSKLLQVNRQWLIDKEWITVMEVRMSPNLSMAKVYISVMLTHEKERTLQKINLRKGEIRKALGSVIGKKIHYIPDLAFCIDDVEEKSSRIESILAKLQIPPIGDEKTDSR